MVYYPNPIRSGLANVNNLGDGYTINLKWHQAYTTVPASKIAYNIYYSIIKEDVFTDGVKYISIDDSLEANIIDLTAGQLYFFCVRPVEYNSTIYDLNTLPIAYDNLRLVPYSLLRSNITSSDTTIPLLDVFGFPTTGVIKIGIELIQYTSIDTILENILASVRGYNNTDAVLHTTDGYDGYRYWNPSVNFSILGEDNGWDHIFLCQCRFEYPNYQRTNADGYHQVVKDLLTTDLSVSDDYNVDFPMYDYAGYHRTDPVLLVNGTCVGSYIGGQMGCIDKYGNVNMVRGISLQDINNQRQELGLSVTGRKAILIKRVRTGITCSCYLPSSEYPDDRCPFCYGTKFVFGYEQYFNPRRSDGRIMVRPGPADEDLKMTEAGMESEFILDFWTQTVPTVKDRDIIILFDMEGTNEEYRYEILSVTRNNTALGLEGGQKFKAQRIRKFDPAYQIRVFKDSSMFPSQLNTTIGFTTGIMPHTHKIVISEKIVSINQINQTTDVMQGHNHPIVNGKVLDAVGHSHNIIL
jgi:hypothetical protein